MCYKRMRKCSLGLHTASKLQQQRSGENSQQKMEKLFRENLLKIAKNLLQRFDANVHTLTFRFAMKFRFWRATKSLVIKFSKAKKMCFLSKRPK